MEHNTNARIMTHLFRSKRHLVQFDLFIVFSPEITRKLYSCLDTIQNQGLYIICYEGDEFRR